MQLCRDLLSHGHIRLLLFLWIRISGFRGIFRVCVHFNFFLILDVDGSSAGARFGSVGVEVCQ